MLIKNKTPQPVILNEVKNLKMFITNPSTEILHFVQNDRLRGLVLKEVVGL